MNKFIKNIEQSKVLKLNDIVDYADNQIASLTLANEEHVGMTIMAFDEGEGVSTHAAGGDAMVYVLDGTADITVDGVTSRVEKGDTIVMPANIPHSVKEVTKYKMLLTVIK